MDVKLIALIVSVVMPIVMFLLYTLSERVKNRNQIVLEIKSGDRGNFDINKRLSFFKNLATGEFDKDKFISGVFSELSWAKSSPYINVTIVNTGRVPITVQELNINFSEMSSSQMNPKIPQVKRKQGY